MIKAAEILGIELNDIKVGIKRHGMYEHEPDPLELTVDNGERKGNVEDFVNKEIFIERFNKDEDVTKSLLGYIFPPKTTSKDEKINCGCVQNNSSQNQCLKSTKIITYE